MRTRLLLASVLLALGLAAPAYARGTLDSILPGLRAEHPGRLSDAQPWTDSDGRTHYRIKWLTPEGRIVYFDADAQSGRYHSTTSGGDGWRGRSRGQESQSGRGGSHWTSESGDGDWTDGRGDWQDRGGDWRGGGSGGGNWHGGGSGGGGSHGGDGGWHGGGHHHHGR
jgi:hypothetical protein